jgi:uncharacterized protein
MDSQANLQIELPRRPSTFKAYLRSCLNAIGTGGLAALTLGRSYFHNPFDVEFVELPMPLRNLPKTLHGFRLLHISDLHTGKGTPAGYLRRVMDRINETPHDLVVITGDFVTHDPREIPLACEIVGRLRPPVVAILGNHDYSNSWATWANQLTAGPLTAALARQGVQVLRNQAFAVERCGGRIWIVGMEDWWSERFSLPPAFGPIPLGEPVVALSHNADSVFALEQAGAQWVLAGHTHGGQIRLPGLGSLMVPQVHKEFDVGLFTVGRCRLYVNRGLGFRNRARFRCRPEVTTFTLGSEG